MKKRFVLIAAHCLLTALIFGQSKARQEKTTTVAATSSTNSSKSYFKPSINYLSNAVYQGRKDSSLISYITPAISYQNKNGFNVSASLSYQANRGINEIDLVSLETGFERDITNSFSAGAYAVAYFYNEFSSSVKSETKGDIGLEMNYSPNGIFDLSGEGGLSFAQKPDIEIAVSLGHSFNLGAGEIESSIAPALVVQAGTQNYYRNYYTDRKFKNTVTNRNRGRGRGNSDNNSGGNGSGHDKIINIVSLKTFSLLDYELTVPFTFENKRWGMFVTPTYTIPLHPLTYTEDNSATPITESLSNSFFINVGAYLKF